MCSNLEEINYYSLAEDDYLFLKYNYEHNIIRNAMTSLSQNICERYLKHIINEYCDQSVTDVLRTHSLRKILNFIQKNIPDFDCNYAVIINADGYYFSTRYLSDDSFFVNERDVEACWEAVCETKKSVDKYINDHNTANTSLLDVFTD